MDSCPHCGNNSGYFIKQQVSGRVKFNFNFDGSSGDNTEMHEEITYSGGKVAYCQDCKKKLFKMET